MKWFNSALLFLSIFLTAVNGLNAAVTDPNVSYNVKRGDVIVSEEGLVVLNVPMDLVVRKAREILLAPGTQIVELSRFEMDPAQNLMLMEGIAELPADIITDMNDIAGGGSFAVKHHFKIAFKLPSSKKLAMTRYFSIEIVEFKLDGQSYLNALHRLGQFAVGLLVNTSFMDYMLDITPEVRAQTEGEPLSDMIKRMIEQKGIRIHGNSLSFKLNLKEMGVFKDYAEVEDLRVWKVAPVLLKGTQKYVLRIEAGLGIPANEWFAADSQRQENDNRTLMEVRKDVLSKYSSVPEAMKHFRQTISQYKKQMNLEEISDRGQKDDRRLVSVLEGKTRTALDMKNELFLANPEDHYSSFIAEGDEYIISVLSALKKDELTRQRISKGGRAGSDRPFLVKRLSQETFSQLVRYFRDFEFENEQMFPEIEAIFDPTVPGVILRGIMNVNINVFMAMGMEGSPVIFDQKKPWRAAEDRYGAGMPFEATLKLTLFDKSELGIDVTHFSILSDSERTSLDVNGKHGQIIATWVKMAIVNTLATTLFEDPRDPGQPQGTPAPIDPNRIKNNVIALEKNYKNLRGKLTYKAEDLLKLATLDLENNPFLTAGVEHVKRKSDYILKNLVRYDEETGMIIAKLDPRLASETIMASQNNVQIWNIGPYYSKKLNRTFFELALGNMTRSKGYLNEQQKRPEERDSLEFVGIDESRDQVPWDMQLNLDLKSFEALANQILADAYQQQNKEVNALLAKENELESYLIRDMTIKAISGHEVQMGMVLTHIKKSERSRINPARWFGDSHTIDKKSISLNLVLGLRAANLKEFKDKLKLAPNEVVLSQDVLAVDVIRAGLTMSGDTGLVDKIVGLVARDLDFKKSSLAKKLKVLVLKFAHGFLHSTDPNKNGNMELGGVRLNQYAKIITHAEEILIQLNPHIGGQAFELKLLPNAEYRGEKTGIVLDASHNEMNLDFTSTGSLSTLDKGDMVTLMKKANDLFTKVNQESDPAKFLAMVNDRSLMDKVFYNSDYTKLSFMHKLKRLMNIYPGVLRFIELDRSVVDTINAQLNTHFGISLSPVNKEQITSTGAELVYFATVTTVLKVNIDRMVAKLNSMNLGSSADISDWTDLSSELERRYINPLLTTYKKDFHSMNQRMAKKGITDWNMTFYPDALFAESCFDLISGLRGERN
ncbi:MAG: hypothetical protein COW00_10200 [Bdellovibrio sp. CG12_big_fil_rev_8_21_14_0_65_39_13]|nr:MAG: hypothetical protein COW00_10200 [Bdellovibrio sp. CG12_big_fil_rev_8_21_14_0_65_39_13]